MNNVTSDVADDGQPNGPHSRTTVGWGTRGGLNARGRGGFIASRAQLSEFIKANMAPLSDISLQPDIFSLDIPHVIPRDPNSFVSQEHNPAVPRDDVADGILEQISIPSSRPL